MNKILFKLIEGKGKFFLMKGYIEPSQFLHSSREGYYEYNRAMKPIIDEALKNGEIVNQEVIHIDWGLTKAGSGGLNNGQIFDLPEGMGFEEVDHYIEWHDRPIKVIRLLPEKPAQKEYVINQPTESGVIGTHFGTVQKEERQDPLSLLEDTTIYLDLCISKHIGDKATILSLRNRIRDLLLKSK